MTPLLPLALFALAAAQAPASLAAVGPAEAGAPGEGPEAQAIAAAIRSAGLAADLAGAQAAAKLGVRGPPPEARLAAGETAWFKLRLAEADGRLGAAVAELGDALPFAPVEAKLARALATAAAVKRARGETAAAAGLFAELAELTGGRPDAVDEASYPPAVVADYRAAAARAAHEPTFYPRALMDRWARRLGVRYLLAAERRGGALTLAVWDASAHAFAAPPRSPLGPGGAALAAAVREALEQAKLTAPPPPPAPPLWKRWYVWAGAGAVVVAAVALPLASRAQPGPTGSLDTLHLPR